MNIVKFDYPRDLVEHVIEDLITLSHTDKEAVHIVLSGGSTPKQIFELLANPHYAARVNWKRCHFWWGDERCVPADDPESNYGAVKKQLFDALPDLPRENIHPIDGVINPDQSSISYTSEIRKYVEVAKHLPGNHLPVFDWIWLGMGDDGHTASLFVDGVPLDDDCWTVVAKHPVSRQKRVTITMGVINAAKRVTFLVTGKGKAEMVAKILGSGDQYLFYPAKHVALKEGRLEWYLDQGAAELLTD
jgi:6-phosphogluconolactonase